MFGLADKVLAYIAAAIALSAIGGCIYLAIQLHEAEGETASVKVDLATRTTERDTCNASVILQNLAIERLKQDTLSYQQAASAALAKAQVVVEVQKPVIKVIHDRIVANKDTCESAVDALRKGLK